MLMASARLVTVTTRSYARALAKEKFVYGEKRDTNCFLTCPKCKAQCMVGQRIVTKRCKNNTKWYHKECAEALNIIWGDEE
jgi:hypothetical protein